ncbi:hypothetical protein K1T71_010216 [Dendrolimus kikuchii]|uniref:Uncharacterized protein n=1 Tax=Dendrolimus kikuchii TaxID=765133 RepID=A0ACC1CR64_9NEOP|nr:hypothetical protein K1T71_010216 [Dendrolimus kikuchii]
MSQNVEDETRQTEINENTITISEIPGKPFSLTVEFPLFLNMLSFGLAGAAISNLILYRTCVHSLNHTESECSVFLSLKKNNETQHLENEVQQYATMVNTVKSVIESLAPALLSMFLGVWSDTYGRKPLIVWPLFGIAITGMLTVVYSMMNNLGPWWYILTVVPYSLTGGFTLLFTGAYCYMSDSTTKEKRSLRMTILEASVSVGSVIGSLLSSYVLKAVGQVYLLLIMTTLNVFAYAFANVCLKESVTGAVQGGLNSVLDWLLVKEMTRECFKKRPNHGRAQILLLTFANSLTIFILYGLISLEYLYTREKLHWSIKNYTIFSAVNTMISFIGGFFGIMVVQRFLHVGDLTFVNIAFLSTIAEYVIKALAVESWHMYLAGGVAVFKGLSSPLIRSLLTKILPLEDIAKVFALMSAVEALCPLLSPVMYNSLYEFTIGTFPGAIYFLSAAISVLCVIFVGFVQYYRWNVSSPYQPLHYEEGIQ